jgi:hypothetical protein
MHVGDRKHVGLAVRGASGEELKVTERQSQKKIKGSNDNKKRELVS